MSEWERANLWRVIDRPEYVFEVEELRDGNGNQMIFIHLAVHQWSKAILKQLIAEFKAFRECTDAPLYCTSPVNDEKWRHFLSFFGWKHLIDAAEGQALYISIKDNKNGARNLEDEPAADQQSVVAAVSVSDPGLQRGV
jgi:hypothetical protein